MIPQYGKSFNKHKLAPTGEAHDIASVRTPTSSATTAVASGAT